MSTVQIFLVAGAGWVAFVVFVFSFLVVASRADDRAVAEVPSIIRATCQAAAPSLASEQSNGEGDLARWVGVRARQARATADADDYAAPRS
jgi:hypothetical protein